MIRIETADAVTTVTIDRPERRNAVDATAVRALYDAFRAFDADPAARVAILAGSGGHFCAGADLLAFAAGDARPIEPEGDLAPMGPTRLQLAKPVIAAVEGYAVAGGLELALWCDLRVAARDAIFGVFCRRFGVPLIDLGTIRLPRLIGQSRAADMILTGRAVGAEEAFAIGLANRLAEPGEALRAARALARELAELPQAALRGDRLSMLEQWSLPGAQAIANEIAHGRRALAEGRAGAARFAAGEGRHGAPS